MIEEHSAKAKADVFDFVIDFLIEHEKTMDRLIQRLEKLLEVQSIKTQQSHDEPPEPKTVKETKPGAFTLTVNNPGRFETLKFVKIGWGEESQGIDDSDTGK